MTPLPLIIAAACMGRGLNAAQSQRVSDVLRYEPFPQTTFEAWTQLDTAIEWVLNETN